MSPITLGILAASGAGAVGSYELISSTVLTSSAASVTFSNLGTSAAAYKHLQIRYTARDSNAANYVETFSIRFNGDTGSNYSRHSLRGNGSSVFSNAGTNQTLIEIGHIAGNSLGSGIFAAGVIDILDFTAAKNKTVRSLTGGASTGQEVALWSGSWMSTAAVTSILLESYGASFITGSRFSLYGLRG